MSEERTSEPHEDKSQKKIIILDDDKFLINMYALKFQTAGVHVDAVETGEELLDRLRADEKADLLLLDIIIPGLSGLDTLEVIRKEKLAKDIKIVMLTNQSDPTEIERAKSLDVDGYIVKAMATPSEVVEQVMKIMNL